MKRIQRASQIAKSRSSQVRFADARSRLEEIKNQQKRRSPVVFVSDLQSGALLCEAHSGRFLFEDEFGGAETIQAFETEYVDIHVLKEAPKERRALTFRDLAHANSDDPIALSYLGEVFTKIDGLRMVKHCSRCGHALMGFNKPCVFCGLQKYPRVNPCAMVLVHDPWNDSILLGRRHNFIRWSLLAGFCEPLESIENCAAREVHEEANITIDRSTLELSISQPWPLINPNFEGISLMFGCFAETTTPNQIPDAKKTNELGEAKWLAMEQVEEAIRFKKDWLPMNSSIATFMIQAFVDAKSEN